MAKTYRINKKNAIIRKEILQLLEDKNLLEDTDVHLVNELVYNLYLADESRKSIAEHGILVNIRKSDENPYYQTNPAVNVYNQAIKAVITFTTKLGITPQERAKLKITSEGDNPLDMVNDEE